MLAEAVELNNHGIRRYIKTDMTQYWILTLVILIQKLVEKTHGGKSLFEISQKTSPSLGLFPGLWLKQRELDRKIRKKCVFCKKKQSRSLRKEERLKSCKGCRFVTYCSRKCQKRDWSRGNFPHSSSCKGLTKIWVDPYGIGLVTCDDFDCEISREVNEKKKK